MDENNKNLFYTWSNVDGDISVFESWSELIEKENWEYLENYHDSLDYFEVGELIPIAPRGEAKGKVYYKDNNGDFFENNDETEEADILQLYYGKALVKSTPSKAEKEVRKIFAKF